MAVQKLAIKPIGNNHYKVYLDNKEIKCYGVYFQLKPDELPMVTIELSPNVAVEYSGNADVEIDYGTDKHS